MRAARRRPARARRRAVRNSARSSPRSRTGMRRARRAARGSRRPEASSAAAARPSACRVRRGSASPAARASARFVRVHRLRAGVERRVPDRRARADRGRTPSTREGRPGVDGERPGGQLDESRPRRPRARGRASRSSCVWTLITSPCGTPLASANASSRSRAGRMTATGRKRLLLRDARCAARPPTAAPA